MTGPIKALTWEFIRRLSVTVPFLISVLLLGPLGLEGLFWVADLPMDQADTMKPLSVHFLYLALGFTLMATPLVEAYKGSCQRIFAFPVSNQFIASWMMVTAIVAVVGQDLLVRWLYGCILSDWSYSGIFGNTRSVIGTSQPVFATLVSMLLAMLWTLKYFKFRKFLVCVALVGLFGYWVISHSSTGFALPKEPWALLTVLDTTICVIVIAASWFVTWRGIARERCGDNVGYSFEIRVQEITARLVAVIFPDGSRTHDSPEAAIAWHEWRWRGRNSALACSIGLGTLLAFMVFLGGSNRGRNPEVGILLLLFLVPGILGLLTGSVLGVLAPVESREGMTNFLATSPVSDARLARGLLRNAFRTTLIAWGLVLIPGILSLAASLLIRGTAPILVAVERLNHNADFRLGAMTIPCILMVSFLLAWTLAAVLAVLHWTGSRYLGLVILVTFITDFFAMFLLRFLVTEETHTIVQEATFGIVSGVIVVGSALGFGVALKRKMIESGSAALLLSFWLVESLLCWFFVPVPAMHRIFLGGILILSVSPVALAPLAISRNRHAA